MKKNSNFISAIAQTANLNDLAKNDPKGKEIINVENDKANEDIPVLEEKTTSIEEDKEENKIQPVVKTDQPKKTKSKNNKEFIDNIIALYNEKNPDKNNEKTSLLVTPQLHYKLKMLALSSKVNLFDLTNAIFTSFLNENKEDIESLMKKLM
ncbi:hypothetical protein [uncultured Flavobacterium sp.]|uniref:hypothetical protein n=1 Tax=uncultured Flavobacterium sp. TaxID=165435 RepID=UPI0025997577|nr:hypothetical protein [uncultured Flavobacterium sp.]